MLVVALRQMVTVTLHKLLSLSLGLSSLSAYLQINLVIQMLPPTPRPTDAVSPEMGTGQAKFAKAPKEIPMCTPQEE